MRLAVFVAIVNITNALSARGWFTKSSPFITGGLSPRPESLDLGVIPFSEPQVLLLGEERKVQVEDTALIQMLDDAEAEYQGTCAQLLIAPDGGVNTVAALCEIYSQHDDPEETLHSPRRTAWLRCVGRVKVMDLQQSDRSYMRARVEPFIDIGEDAKEVREELAAVLLRAAPSAGDQQSQSAAEADGREESETAFDAAKRIIDSASASSALPASNLVDEAQALLANLEGELESTFRAVVQLRHQLAGEVGTEKAAAADIEGGEAPRSGLMESDGAEMVECLDELTQLRRKALLAPGAHTAPRDTTLSGEFGDLWGTPDDQRANYQLRSFAAFSAVSDARVRVYALSEQSATQRVIAALAALREERQRLAAQLSLYKMGGDADAKS